MIRSPSWPLALLFSLCALAVSHSALAQESGTDRARSHLRAGVAYYDAARYEDAAREMEEAYRLRPLPELQYNLAQCYERLGRTKDAIAAYLLYVDGKPAADDKAEVSTRVANLKERLAKEGDAGATNTSPAPPEIREKVVLKEVVVYKEAPPKPGRGLRGAAYALGVVAVGALAAGATFTVLAHRDGDQVTAGGNPAAPVPFDGAAAETQAAGHQDTVLAFVGYGVGVVAIVGAVGLYVLGNKVDQETARQLSIAPVFTNKSGGLALSGSF